MEKNKMLHRVCISFVLLALLLVFLTPMMISPASAMVVEPYLDVDGNPMIPTIYELVLPLDKFTIELNGLTFENPLCSVAVEDGCNRPFNIEMPFDDGTEDRMHFEVLEVRQPLDYKDGVCAADFGIQIPASSNYLKYNLSNTLPFVRDSASVRDALYNCRYTVQPGYKLIATVNFEYYYPSMVSDSGYKLVKMSDYQRFTFSNDYVEGALSVPIFDEFDDTYLPEYLFNPSYDDGMRLIECLFTHFSITFELFNPYDGYMDVGVDDSPNASFQDFSFDVRSPYDYTTIVEFYEKYPGNRVIVSPSAGDSLFDLTTGLKLAVEGFFATEIAPGFTLGGLLTTIVGLLIVFVLFKGFA